LSLTSEGEKAFFAWLDEPTASSPRLLHLEFLARLYFASRIAPSRVPELIQAQTDVLVADLSRLEALQATPTASIEHYSADFRCRQLRAALVWIRETISPQSSQRF
jgi:hypothetical protein